MRNTQAKISELQSQITREVQNRIKSLSLISTGKMLSSVDTKLVKNDKGYTVNVKSTDYFPILDAKHNIVDFVVGSERILTLLAELFADEVLEKLNLE